MQQVQAVKVVLYVRRPVPLCNVELYADLSQLAQPGDTRADREGWILYAPQLQPAQPVQVAQAALAPEYVGACQLQVPQPGRQPNQPLQRAQGPAAGGMLVSQPDSSVLDSGRAGQWELHRAAAGNRRRL